MYLFPNKSKWKQRENLSSPNTQILELSSSYICAHTKHKCAHPHAPRTWLRASSCAPISTRRISLSRLLPCVPRTGVPPHTTHNQCLEEAPRHTQMCLPTHMSASMAADTHDTHACLHGCDSLLQRAALLPSVHPAHRHIGGHVELWCSSSSIAGICGVQQQSIDSTWPPMCPCVHSRESVGSVHLSSRDRIVCSWWYHGSQIFNTER